MLCEVRNALLGHGEDEVGLELDNLLVRLALALHVLRRAVKKDDARLLNPLPHLRVRDVFVKHDAVQDSPTARSPRPVPSQHTHTT